MKLTDIKLKSELSEGNQSYLMFYLFIDGIMREEIVRSRSVEERKKKSGMLLVPQTTLLLRNLFFKSHLRVENIEIHEVKEYLAMKINAVRMNTFEKVGECDYKTRAMTGFKIHKILIPVCKYES